MPGIRMTISLFMMTALLTQPLLAASSGSPRLIPLGNVRLVDTDIVLDREAPAPEGALMVCNSQCFIEASGLQLLGADKSVFAIREGKDHFTVMVREGSLDFAISDNAKPVVFSTPFDTFDATARAIPVGSDAVVRGNLLVTEERAILSMTQGSLELVTADGKRLIEAGNVFVLAQYSAGGNSPSMEEENMTGMLVAAGTVGIIGATIAALAGGGSGGGGGGDGDAASSK